MAIRSIWPLNSGSPFDWLVALPSPERDWRCLRRELSSKKMEVNP